MGASKKSKSKRSKVTVGFEDEMVKKEDARVILKQISDHRVTQSTTTINATHLQRGVDSVKQKRKKNKVIDEVAAELSLENDRHQNENVGRDFTDRGNNSSSSNGLEVKTSKKMKKKRHLDSDNLVDGNTEDASLKKKKKKDVEEVPHEDNTLDADEPITEKKESIRAQKRRKHAELLSQKKMKAELKMQNNVLNYLSKWKHSRPDWKFEKLKQIWLQQNLYETAKITKEFWDVTLEYFAGSKGATRQAILKDAIKMIDKYEQSEGSNEDEDYQVKLQRARDLIQYLQE